MFIRKLNLKDRHKLIALYYIIFNFEETFEEAFEETSKKDFNRNC